MVLNSDTKVLLFGSSGMLGRELERSFSQSSYKVIPLTSLDVDITNKEAVFNIIKINKPDIILNAAVKVNVDECEKDPETARMINALGPKYIAEAFQTLELGYSPIFVHYSSSDIFGSDFEETPDEDDGRQKTPANIYGRTKLEGESYIRNICENNGRRWYIVRSSWIYSEFKKTFIDTIVKHIKNKNDVMQLVENQRGVPTWGKEIAENTLRLIEEDYSSGTYHFVAEVREMEATRFEIAETIAEYFEVKQMSDLFFADKQENIFKTPRPYSSAIKNTKFPKLPYWKDSLYSYLKLKY